MCTVPPNVQNIWAIIADLLPSTTRTQQEITALGGNLEPRTSARLTGGTHTLQWI